MGWMYILECSDCSYYVGSTTNLARRLWERQEGIGARYTSQRLPIKLVYAAEFSNLADAYAREKQVQGWSRAKRKVLIEGNFDVLPTLSHNPLVGSARGRARNRQAP